MFKLRETPQDFINFWICFLRENESDSISSFFMNGISGTLVWRVFSRVLCFAPKLVHTNFEPFLRYSSPSLRCLSGPTLLLHGCRPTLDTPSFRGADVIHVNRHLSKPTKGSASRRPNHHRDNIVACGLRGSGAPPSPHSHFIKPMLTASTNSYLPRHRCVVSSSSRHPPCQPVSTRQLTWGLQHHPANLLRYLG